MTDTTNETQVEVTLADRLLLAKLAKTRTSEERQWLVARHRIQAEKRKAPRKVREGETPLDDNLGHRLLDVVNEGRKARDEGTSSPYGGHSLEHCLHATGWVQQDLRLALDKAKRTAPRSVVEALEKLIAACRAGRLVPKPGSGVCGMTIEAQTRASNINGVDAWAVEEAQAVIDDIEALTSLTTDDALVDASGTTRSCHQQDLTTEKRDQNALVERRNAFVRAISFIEHDVGVHELTGDEIDYILRALEGEEQ